MIYDPCASYVSNMTNTLVNHYNHKNAIEPLHRLVVESRNSENSFAAVSSVSARRAANRLILYRYGVGS
ncbi:unnamed protein product [Brassica oleracea var. botrytis]